MALALEYSRDNHGAWATASDRLTGDEVVAALQEVNARNQIAPIFYTFFDFNAVAEIDLATPQLQKAASTALEAARRERAPRIVAICATSDLSFGLARMYMAMIDETGWEAAVFRARPEAITWLRNRVAAKFGVAIEIA